MRWLVNLPKLKKISGKDCVKILCKEFGFTISGRKGSHVRLSKKTDNGKIGTVVPMHKELKIGTLKGILKLAKINEEDFKI